MPPSKLFRTRLALCLLGMAGLAASLPAFAQVLRCTDPRTGQVTYTDGSCAGGTAVREVEPRKTPEELEQEREQAAQALERRQQRLQAEAAAAEQDARRAAELERARAAAAPPPHDYARSPECARSRRHLEQVAAGMARSTYEQEMRLDAAQRQADLDCLGPQGYAEVERARAQQPRVVVVPPSRHRPLFPDPFPQMGRPEPPPRLTQCGDFSCTDNRGKKYPIAGPGRFPGPGGVCRSGGGQAPC